MRRIDAAQALLRDVRVGAHSTTARREPRLRCDVMDWQLALAGLLVGMLVGVTGMGGGSLLTPLLVIFFGYSPATAVGTDLLHGAVFKSVGAVRHRRLGTVQARLSGWMFLGSAPMSLLGVATASWLKHRYGDGADSVQGIVLGIALVAGGLGLIAKSVLRFREVPPEPFVLTKRDRIAAVLIGVGGGYIVGLTSVGSGVFFGLTMLVVFPLQAQKIVGTDLFHAAALLWVAGLSHLLHGNVDAHAMAWLLVGSVPGVLLGSHLSIRVPDRSLRIAFSFILLLSGIKLLEVPGAPAIIVVGLALGAVALAAMAVRSLAARRVAPAAD